jgi:hypothetical protein
MLFSLISTCDNLVWGDSDTQETNWPDDQLSGVWMVV